MKFIKKHGFTILILLVSGYVLLPRAWKNFGFETKPLEADTYPVISLAADIESLTFPPTNKNAIGIFWATWCGPCKIEMNRLAQSVKDGKIPASQIFAINVNEPPSVVKKFLTQTPYPFTFIQAPEVVEKLQVNSTPTVIFIENGLITSQSSGMSLIGIWRAESLFH